jgi:hypothetical protein
VNPNNKNNVVAVFRDFQLGGGENNTTAIRNCGLAATTDGGVTWHETLAAFGDHNRFSDPNVAVDNSGNFYVVTLDCNSPPTETFNVNASNFTVRESSDGGITWFDEVATDPEGWHDKEMIAVDGSPSSLFVGNVYVNGDLIVDNGQDFTSGMFSSGPPAPGPGLIFSGPTLTPPYYPVPAVGINGELYTTFEGDTVAVAKSTDGGASFGDAVNVSHTVALAQVGITNSPVALSSIGEPVVCVDRSQSPRRGNVYVAWLGTPYGDGDVFCARSTDGGATWLPTVRVNDDSVGNGKDQFHHGMTVDDSGFVDLVFLDRRNDSANVFCDAYFAQSRDGGKSFKNFRLTPQSFDPRITPGPDARIGDYMGIAAAQGRIVPVWVDTHLGDQDIYVSMVDQNKFAKVEGNVFADCNSDGVQDSGETGIGNMLVYLLHDAGFDTVRTDSTGHYVFDGLFAGAYSISVGGGQTFPAGGDPYNVTLSATQDLTAQNFGVSGASLHAGVIAGTVYATCGGAASHDSVGAGDPGVLVLLTHDSVVDSVRTDSSGHYSFTGLSTSSYTVSTSAAQLYPSGGHAYSVELCGGETLRGNDFVVSSINIPTAVPGWNLISLPRQVAGGGTASVFSGLTARVFGYDLGYRAEDSLFSGSGYWIEAACGSAESMNGDSLNSFSISLVTGWNIVGALSVPFAASAVQTNPSVVLGPYYGYADSSGYTAADTLVPGKGYWVKSPEAVTITLSTGASAVSRARLKADFSRMSTLTFGDDYGHSRSLFIGTGLPPGDLANFELPPKPPVGTFDVRFGSQRNVELVSAADASAHAVEIQTSSPKIRLTWNMTGGAGFALTTGSSTRTLAGNGSIELSAAQTRGLSISAQGGSAASVPKSFALEQNYPDPFNPVTTIHYQLPAASQVNITVYNTLGQVVSTLASGIESAGFKSVTWDGSNQPSGVYFYRLDAASVADPGSAFHQVLKMVLIK